MIGRLILPTACALFFVSMPTLADSFEETKTRPDKQEITNQMIQIGRMSLQQRDSRVDQITGNQSVTKTPRSDFMFCVGLAYLGNYKAQTCVASAYENGRGVVEDLSEAYTWYFIAYEGQAQKPTEEKAQALMESVKNRLVSAYPHPTEDDLDDMVKAQKARIAQYQAEAKKIKNY
jgi:hypothetical protein